MPGYTDLTDFELATLLKEGDRAAFTEIYNRFALILLNHAYNKLRNREEARDVVHEAFSIIWVKRDLINLETNIGGYLFTIIRNTTLNQLLQKKVKDKYLVSIERFSYEPIVQTDYLLRERELKLSIEKEIAALPPKMRKVFELSRKSYLNHKQISNTLDISEQTVSKHITNALKILRFKLHGFSELIVIIIFSLF